MLLCVCGLHVCGPYIHMCMFIHAHKESRAGQLPFSVPLHLIALRQGLLVNLTISAFWLAWLAGQRVLGIFLSVSRCCSYRLTWYRGEDLNSVSCLEGELPFLLSHLFPSPHQSGHSYQGLQAGADTSLHAPPLEWVFQ